MKKPLGISIFSYVLLILPLFFFFINLPFRGVMPLDMVMVIALCVIIGYGLRKQRSWARPLMMVFWLVVIHEHLGNDRFYNQYNGVPWINSMSDLYTLIGYAVLASFTYWYFYRKPSLKNYYKNLIGSTQPLSRKGLQDQMEGAGTNV
jgi:hypothetical protein